MCKINRETRGILLIASGTRSLLGQYQTQEFAAELKRYMGRNVPIVTTYLAVQKPSLQTVMNIIDETCVQNWLCVPLFLFLSGYSLFDSQLLVSKFFLFKRPYLNLRWMPAWGTDRQLISTVAGYIHRLLLDFDDNTSSVRLVGGASSSTKIYQKYCQVAESISKWLGRQVQPSVLAGIGKSVYDVFNDRETPLTLFVPYLAFDGLLMEQFRKHNSDPRNSISRKFVIAEPLFTQPNFKSLIYRKISERFYDEVYIDRTNRQTLTTQ